MHDGDWREELQRGCRSYVSHLSYRSVETFEPPNDSWYELVSSR